MDIENLNENDIIINQMQSMIEENKKQINLEDDVENRTLFIEYLEGRIKELKEGGL